MTKKKAFIGSAAIMLALLLTSISYAGGQVRALNILPYNLEVQEGKVVKVPYSGTASYSGSVPYSGSVGYTGSAPYSGSVDYSGMAPFSADYSGEITCNGKDGYTIPVLVEGTTPYTYTAWTLDADECTNGILLGDGVRECANNNDRDRCCYLFESNWFKTEWKCYGVNPLLAGEIRYVCPYSAFSEETFNVDVPFSKTVDVDVPANDPYNVPYSGTVTGETFYSGSASYSGKATCEGTVDYSGTAKYEGTVNYSGETDWIESDSEPYPVLVVEAGMGEKIDGIQAVGWTWSMRTVKYRIVVRYFEPGATTFKVVFKTEVEKATIDGEFTDSIENGFTFGEAGTYVFVFQVMKPDGTVGSVKTRAVVVHPHHD